MKISEYLKKEAQHLASLSPELVAINMLKQAGVSEEDARLSLAQNELEKTAAAGIHARGVDFDEALKLVKTAGVKVQDLPGFKLEPLPIESQIEILEKTASDVENLENAYLELLEKVAELEDKLNFASTEGPAKQVLREKIAGTTAFTNADLDELMNLPTETLTKIASSQEQPWRMGSAEGTDATSMDPLRQFILS